MLRKEIIKSVQNVLSVLTATKLVDNVLLPRLTKEKPVDPIEVIAAFSVINQMSQEFGDTERKILSDLDLDALLSQKFWSSLFTDSDKIPIGRTQHHMVYGSLQFAVTHLPKLIKILERENDAVLEAVSEDAKKAGKVGSITVIVIEDNQVSTPNRLVLMLEAIEGLYDASSHIAGLEGNDLSVVSCDSGSDKSFDFLGAAQIMTIVKEIIIDFWNKLVYFREDKSERHLELLSVS